MQSLAKAPDMLPVSRSLNCGNMSQASIVEVHPQPWVATYATCTQSYDDPSALSLIRLGGRVANGLVVCETALDLELRLVTSESSPSQRWKTR